MRKECIVTQNLKKKLLASLYSVSLFGVTTCRVDTQSSITTSDLLNKKPQRGVLEDVFVVMCAQVLVTMVGDMIMNSI